jgi:hypothetical protein
MVAELEEDAQRAAAKRRITSGAELATYMRWRFSCREGELLILDPYIFRSKGTRLLEFLASFDRQIRVLTAEIKPPAARLLARTPWLEARALPKGLGDLHDRVWIVGDTALLAVVPGHVVHPGLLGGWGPGRPRGARGRLRSAQPRSGDDRLAEGLR